MPQQVSVSLGANPAGFIAGMRAAGTAAEGFEARTAGVSKNLKLLGGAFIAEKIVHGFFDAAKAAGDYQAQIVRLKTDANESASNLNLVSKGLLNLAGATGTSTTALTAGMYKIESAGFHGAAALTVAKAAAEGAKVGFADMTTVADALTTAMTDYSIPAAGATATTNQLIAAVSRGKTDLESLSASLSTVAPVAHAAGIGLSETLGAMSTMTAQGTPAAKAATYLAQTIKSIEAPTAKSTKELQAIGLSAADLSTNLGSRGLANTLDTIVGAIKNKMGPAGEVMLTNLQKLSGNTSDFQKILADVPPSMQSYVQALALSTGSTKTLQAVLELVNNGTGKFRENTKAAADAARGAGKDVHDWDVVQKNFNQRMSEAGGQFEKVKIALGQDLLPIFTSAATKLGDFGKLLGKYPGWVKGITFTLVGYGGLVLAFKALSPAIDAVRWAMGRSIATRAASTASLVAEGAAADKATASLVALDLAEGSSKVGLRTPLMPGALTNLGLAGAATTGGETAAIGGAAGSLTVAGGLAIGGALVVAGATTFASVKIANWAYNSTPAATQQNSGSAPAGAGPGGTLTKSQSSTYVNEYLAAAGLNPDGSKRDDSKAGQQAAALAAVGQMKVTEATVKSLTTTYNEQVPALTALSAAYNQNKTWMQLTAAQADQLVQAQNKIGPATTNLTKLIGQQTAAFTVLNTAGQNAVVANENYQASIAGLKQSVKENGTSLDQTTAKGRANTDAMVAQAGAINEVDTAYFNAQEKTKGYKTALAEVTTKLQGQKQSLIDQATGLGISQVAAKKLVDEILKTPKQVTTDFNSPQLTAMSKKVEDLQNQINQLTGKPYHITVTADLPASLQSTKNQQVPHYTANTHVSNGHNTASGYTAGIASGMPLVQASAKAMAKAASDEVAKFNESQSPSKLYHRHGYNTATGLAKGHKAGHKTVADSATKLAKAANTAFEKELKAGTTAAIAAMGKQISIDSKSLTKWKNLLSGARTDKANAMSGAKGVFTGTGDLSAITGATTKGYTAWDGTVIPDSTAPVTAGDINASLTATRTKDLKFLTDLKQAKKLGLKDPYWSTILGYGPDVGEPILQAILAGGKSEVNTVNSLESGIAQIGNQAASIVGAPYTKDINAYIVEVQKLTAALAKENAARDKARAINLTITASDSDAKLKQIEQALAAMGVKLNLKIRTG